MAGDHFSLRVDQHRHVEAERLDAPRDLPDLPGAMRARVLRIELELGDRAISYLKSSLVPVEVSRGMFLTGSSLHQGSKVSKMSLGVSWSPALCSLSS